MSRWGSAVAVGIALFYAAAGAAVGGEPAFLGGCEAPGLWRAAAGVTIEAADVGGAGRRIKVAGRQEGGWNYVRTAPFAVRPGGKYRISGTLLVSKTDPAHPPYFNVEFAAKTGEGWDESVGFGQVTTDRYDLDKGGWQSFEAEFEAPHDEVGAYIAIDKGTQAAIEILAYMGEVRVEEIGEFSRLAGYRFQSRPQPLDSLKNTHPRLHLTAERAAELKALVKSDARYAAMFEEIKAMADRAVESGPPEYVLDDKWSGTEQLWQRGVGEMMPHIALAYLISGEKRYLDCARDWMRASCGYETWGLPPFENIDLAAGHQLYGLAVAYDWLYHDLDEETKKIVRDRFADKAGFMYRQAANEQAWWHNSYLQNHLWVNITGLAAAGMAVYGEIDDIDGWITLPLEKYRVTFAALGPDGASHEGVPYWTYGVEYMLKFADLADDLLGEDFLAGSAWFERTPYYRLYSSLPRNHWSRRSNLMSYADSPRWDWYGPEYMLRKLASYYRDGHAQWLADALDGANVCGRTAAFLNLVWYDPSVVPASGPGDLPTFRHFEDMGLVFMRSDWSGDETLCSFKCGPHIGHEAVRMFDYDPGGGHVHPDAGAFQIFSHGDWLIIDDGYTWKTTGFQNTLLVDGVGQEGEGRAWFAGGDLCRENRGAKMLAAVQGADMDYAIGDVTDAYRKEAGLEKFIREFYYIKPSTWVVIDRLEAEEPATFELYFHAEWPFEEVAEGVWQVKGERGALRLWPLRIVDPVAAVAFKQDLKDTGGAVGENKIDALKISNPEKKESVVFVTVLSAYPAAAEEPPSAFPWPLNGWNVQIRTAEGERVFTLEFSEPAGAPSLHEVK